MSAVSRPATKLRTQIERDGERPAVVMGRLFKNMHQSMRQAIEESMRQERVNLSFAHFVPLYMLSCEPGLPGAELARRAFVTAQTMNTILRRLEKEGSIERVPHPSNQRADSWHITKLGQMRLDKARVVTENVWEKMFESFKEQEVAQLQRLLERCLAGLERQVADLRAAKNVKTSAAATRAGRSARLVRRG